MRRYGTLAQHALHRHIYRPRRLTQTHVAPFSPPYHTHTAGGGGVHHTQPTPVPMLTYTYVRIIFKFIISHRNIAKAKNYLEIHENNGVRSRHSPHTFPFHASYFWLNSQKKIKIKNKNERKFLIRFVLSGRFGVLVFLNRRINNAVVCLIIFTAIVNSVVFLPFLCSHAPGCSGLPVPVARPGW